jgi:hypothetical protein
MLEVFFDLFFAANYTVFSKTQSVTSAARIGAYIGYFRLVGTTKDQAIGIRLAWLTVVSLMWFTWLAVALYDVRFVTDSIFGTVERWVMHENTF